MFSTTLRRQFARYALRRREKILVQLLKDVPSVGVAGEILKVQPAYMRNFLHVNNKACYITESEGPRIPVVEKVRQKAPELKPKVTAVPQKSVSDSPALSLDELSDLFSSMRSKSGKKSQVGSVQTSATSAYSLVDLESLPAVYTLKATLPVEKSSLVQAVFNATGVEVPENMIKIRKEDGSNLDVISEAGSYSWVFSAPGESSVLRKKLVVL